MTDRSVKVYLKGDISDYNRAILSGVATTKAFTKELDTSNDRTTLLTQSLLAVGPALVPIGAAGVPIIAGLTNQMAFAAAGAGVMALAFSGVGDALKATNDYAIDPTEANLAKMKETMNELGPAGRDFVGYLQELRPQLQGLQDIAQEGLLPGAQAGIEDLMTRLPQVERIISQIASGMGELIAEAGDNLADPRWDEFFTFLETEAKPTLLDMGRTLGNFVEGLANIWMAFQPVSAGFSKSFLDLSRDFAIWTDGLAETEGFQEFVDYLNRVGPKAWDSLGALGGALLDIVTAAAPVGEVMLPVIEAVAESIGAIAGSDLGPAVVGVLALTSAYARLIAVGQTVNSSAIGGMLGKSTFGGAARAAKDLPAATRAYLDFGAALDKTGPKTAGFASTNARLSASMKGVAKIAGGAGGLAFVMSDLDDKMGLSNTSMGAMAGSMLGPWGAAVGAGVGLTMDFANANDGLWQSIDRANKALEQGPDGIEQQREAVAAARKEVDALRDSVSFDSGFSIGNYLKSYKDGIEDIFGKSDVQEAEEAWAKSADALDRNEVAARDARLSEAGLSDSLRGTTDATRDQVDAVLSLIDARNRAANEALTALDAELAYEAALDAAAEGAMKNGKSFDDTTEAGRANLALLSDLGSSWNNLSDSQRNVPGEYERMRGSFIKSAEAMGATRKQAEKLADEILAIPTDISTDVALYGAEEAVRKARGLKSILDALDGKVSESIVRTMYETYDVPRKTKGDGLPNPLTGIPEANGGVLSFYANGGLRENHVAQIAPAGAMRVWAEPETGGEAYIPLALSKRKRSQEIAMQTAQRLGGVAYFANGGVSGGGSGGGPMTASLVGARIAIDKDGLASFVDGRIVVGLGGSDNYAAANRRAGRKG